MITAVIRSGDYSRVINRTYNTREWEGYGENAACISDALRKLGHTCHILEDGLHLSQTLAELRPDLVWICSGGIQGRDSATHLPGQLEMLGIRYVGSTPLASGISDNKVLAKMLASQAGVPTPDFRVVRVGDPEISTLLFPPFPLIVKPVCGLCTCGVFKVERQEELLARIHELQERYHSDVLVETYVQGMDISVCCVETKEGLRFFPIMERFFKKNPPQDGITFNKQHPRAELYEAPAIRASLEQPIATQLEETARALFRLLQLRHFARIDFRVSGSDYFMIEVTHKPDLTRNSVFVKSAEFDGLPFDDLIALIVGASLRYTTG